MNDNIECPQGDLISRVAIKQEILPLLSSEERIVIESKIDNAQGYEQEVYLDETSLNHYIEGYREARKVFERPRGKWVYRQEWFEDEKEPRMAWGCNQCGFSIKSVHEKRNFCPNCGANMRGEENEVQDKS